MAEKKTNGKSPGRTDIALFVDKLTSRRREKRGLQSVHTGEVAISNVARRIVKKGELPPRDEPRIKR